MQTWASVEHGYAYARSPELMQLPYMQTLRWMRVPGDTLFAVGAVAIIAFIFGIGRTSKVRVSRPGTSSALGERRVVVVSR